MADKTKSEAVNLLRELLDNVGVFNSALEADHGYDLEDWAERARAALEKLGQVD